MKKRLRKRGKFVADNAPDDPLGIGVSKKTLIWVGVGIVAVIALKIYLDKKKAALVTVASAASPSMNGLGVAASTDAPAGPPGGCPSFGQLPQSPRPAGASIADASRGGYSRASRFSDGGDGGLSGANSRL